jgi:hypothetical protein
VVEGALIGAEKDPGFFAALRMTKETAVRCLLLNAGYAKVSFQGRGESVLLCAFFGFVRRVCRLLPLSMLFPRLLRMASFSLMFGVRLLHMVSFGLMFSARLLHMVSFGLMFNARLLRVMGFGLVPFSAGLFCPMCYNLMFFGPMLFLGARLFAMRFK